METRSSTRPPTPPAVAPATRLIGILLVEGADVLDGVGTEVDTDISELPGVSVGSMVCGGLGDVNDVLSESGSGVLDEAVDDGLRRVDVAVVEVNDEVDKVDEDVVDGADKVGGISAGGSAITWVNCAKSNRMNESTPDAA